MKIALIVGGVLILIALLFVGQLFGMKNELVVKKNSIDGSWAQVDTDIKRRADLIPNLVETVKGFAKQEKSVIDSVTSARAALGGARTPQEKIQANDQLSGALSRLLVVVENYPNIKSNENFLRLQDEIAGTENRIAISRRDYNKAIQDYNTTIELFPKSIAASIFGYQRNDAYFKTTEEDKKVPKVAF